MKKRLNLIDLNKKKWQWTLLIVCAFIWGSSFILMKKGLEAFSFGQVAAFRMFFSFLLTLPLIYKHYKKISKKNIRYLLIVGIIGSGIPAVLFTKGQTEISSSLAGMLNGLTPFFTLILGVLIYRVKATVIKMLGVALGLIGTAGLLFKGTNTLLEGNIWFSFFIITATLCYGLNINVIKFRLKELSGPALTSLGFLFIGPLGGIYLLFSDFSEALASPVFAQSLTYIFILSLFSSVIALIIINILIKYISPIFAASVTYIIPVFAIIWGVIDGEKFTILQFLWIMVIMAGIYLVTKNKK
ncbi:DMT family transporter [Bacteroidota bacterium]